jgi:hypothetical protein
VKTFFFGGGCNSSSPQLKIWMTSFTVLCFPALYFIVASRSRKKCTRWPDYLNILISEDGVSRDQTSGCACPNSSCSDLTYSCSGLPSSCSSLPPSCSGQSDDCSEQLSSCSKQQSSCPGLLLLQSSFTAETPGMVRVRGHRSHENSKEYCSILLAISRYLSRNPFFRYSDSHT